MARWCMSDIHGCYKTFCKALIEINFSKNDTLLILGDMIDRGVNSKAVIDKIIELKKDKYNIIVLKGNHCAFALESLDNPGVYNSWMMNGGKQTLESYGYVYCSSYTEDPMEMWPKFIPQEHMDFFNSLKLVHEEDDYIFVHGGLNFYLEDPIKNSTEDDILWTRLNRKPIGYYSSKLGGRTLVTGHTPTDKQTMIEMTNEDHICVDRGCVFQNATYGHLAVLNLDDKQFRWIKNCDVLDSGWMR